MPRSPLPGGLLFPGSGSVLQPALDIGMSGLRCSRRTTGANAVGKVSVAQLPALGSWLYSGPRFSDEVNSIARSQRRRFAGCNHRPLRRFTDGELDPIRRAQQPAVARAVAITVFGPVELSSQRVIAPSHAPVTHTPGVSFLLAPTAGKPTGDGPAGGMI